MGLTKSRFFYSPVPIKNLRFNKPTILLTKPIHKTKYYAFIGLGIESSYDCPIQSI